MGMIFFGRWYASSQRLMAAEVDVLTDGDPFSEPTPQRRFGRARQDPGDIPGAAGHQPSADPHETLTIGTRRRWQPSG